MSLAAVGVTVAAWVAAGPELVGVVDATAPTEIAGNAMTITAIENASA